MVNTWISIGKYIFYLLLACGMYRQTSVRRGVMGSFKTNIENKECLIAITGNLSVRSAMEQAAQLNMP